MGEQNGMKHVKKTKKRNLSNRKRDEKDTDARESGKQENAGNSGFLNHSL